MFRVASNEDSDKFCSVWHEVFGDPIDFAKKVFDGFAGCEHVYVCEKDNDIVAILCAIPVSLQNKSGHYYYGLATLPQHRGKRIMSDLMQYAQDDLSAKGSEFLCLIPASASLFDFYAERGYEKAFPVRFVDKTIKRNLWAQAQWDTLTVKALEELRSKYEPKRICFHEEEMIAVITDLYCGGITIVSDDNSYGMFFTKGDTLEFIEFFAKDDRSAQHLLEAVRDRTGVENARLMLGANQEIFIGEGKITDYAMIKFLTKPFDVSESYMRLMMDAEG